jgi:hypothetical protein
MAPEHLAHVAGAGLVAEFLQLPGDALVTPAIVFFGQAHNQSFGFCRFAGTPWLWRLILEGPFLLFLAPIPGQERFRLGDGYDVTQTSLNFQAVFHQNAPVHLGQGHSGAELAAQYLVLLPQVIIFQGEVMVEKLVHLCDQRIGRIPRIAVHRRQHNGAGGPGEFKTPSGRGIGWISAPYRVAGYNAEDGTQVLASHVDKLKEGRESALQSNLIVMVEALKSAGLYHKTNLRPNNNQRAVIHVLAGFTSNAKQVHTRANRERKRLAKLGIVLPEYHWGIPFPKNALRRTSLSMYYKLFGSEALAEEWAGNGDVFHPYYKRLVTKEGARLFWVMLPTQLAGIPVKLPEGHKLDSAMTDEVKAAVSAACETMKPVTARLAEAKAKAAAARPAELKARTAIYNKRAFLKRKAKQLAAEQQHKSQPGTEPASPGNGS